MLILCLFNLVLCGYFFSISYFREGYSQFEESTSEVIVKPLKGSYVNRPLVKSA